jgi:putative ABC transport system permease protein
VVKLLTKEFIILVLLANLAAWPIAYYFMDKWLLDFTYRINISVWSFIIAAFSILLIAIVTVNFQAIKAARANPVDSLRYE